MADALVEPSVRVGPVRFFCHRCNLEFEDALQEYICPYCSGGFIEELAAEVAGEAAGARVSTDSAETMDTDSDDVLSVEVDDELDGEPFVNDLTFLMSGGRLRGMLGGAETLLQHLVLALAGGADAQAAGAGAPIVLVGAPGDYVFGGEGLDAVVTQLLGQLEGAGPPPLPGDQLELIRSVAIIQEQVTARLQCSVCWDHFLLDERVSQLACEHVFHTPCIRPWLQLHATCPICRHCLLPGARTDVRYADPPEMVGHVVQMDPRATMRQRAMQLMGHSPASDRVPRADTVSTSPSTSGSTSSVTSWGPSTQASTTSGSERSEPSRQSSQYNMDLDFN